MEVILFSKIKIIFQVFPFFLFNWVLNFLIPANVFSEVQIIMTPFILFRYGFQLLTLKLRSPNAYSLNNMVVVDFQYKVM